MRHRSDHARTTRPPRPGRPRLGARFHALTAAVGVSGLGDGLALVAVPLLAAQLTRSPFLVAVTVAVQQLPWLLVALPAGALVDRLDRRRVAVLADLGRAATVAALAALVAADFASLPALWLAAFLLGSLDTLATGAAYAVLPRLVPDRLLGRANGRLMAVELTTAQLVGPAVAGAVFATSAALPFALDALSFVVSAALVAVALAGVATRVAFPDPTGPPDDGGVAVRAVWRDVRAGLAWFGAHPGLRTLAATVAGFALCGAAATATLVLFARDRLGLGEEAFGLLVAAGAAGMVVGGLVGGRLADGRAPAPVVVVAGAVAGLAYVVIGLTRSPLVAGAALVVEGLAIGAANTVTLAVRQRAVPDALLGRVGNAFRVLVVGAVPVGAAIGGALAAATSLAVPWVAAGAAQVVLAVVVAAPLRRRLGVRVPADAVVADLTEDAAAPAVDTDGSTTLELR